MNSFFEYHGEFGIIDWFFGTMTKDELLASYRSIACGREYEKALDDLTSSLDAKEQYIIRTINAEQKEKPHTIRYFCIPDFDNLTTTISAVAKISNNGTTYLFTDDKDLYDMYVARSK